MLYIKNKKIGSLMRRKKIALVGAGNIGSTLAHLSLLKNLEFHFPFK